MRDNKVCAKCVFVFVCWGGWGWGRGVIMVPCNPATLKRTVDVHDELMTNSSIHHSGQRSKHTGST